MVERELPKLRMRVRFPLSAPLQNTLFRVFFVSRTGIYLGHLVSYQNPVGFSLNKMFPKSLQTKTTATPVVLCLALPLSAPLQNTLFRVFFVSRTEYQRVLLICLSFFLSVDKVLFVEYIPHHLCIFKIYFETKN